MDVLLLQLAAALAQGADVPGPYERDDLLESKTLREGFADLLATWALSEDNTAGGAEAIHALREPDRIKLQADAAPDGRIRGVVRESRDVDPRAELVAGLRILRDRVEQLEVETASVMRRSGTTVRQLAHATGLSERQANNRYRRVLPPEGSRWR